jgi:hypothetical protein
MEHGATAPPSQADELLHTVCSEPMRSGEGVAGAPQPQEPQLQEERMQPPDHQGERVTEHLPAGEAAPAAAAHVAPGIAPSTQVDLPSITEDPGRATAQVQTVTPAPPVRKRARKPTKTPPEGKSSYRCADNRSKVVVISHDLQSQTLFPTTRAVASG